MNLISQTKRKVLAVALLCILMLGGLTLLAPPVDAAVVSVWQPGYAYHPGAPGLPAAFSQHWGQCFLYSANGVPVYCLELLNHNFYGGVNYYESYDDVSSMNTTQNYLVSLALAYGYDGTTKYGASATDEQVATQIVIWMIASNTYDDGARNAILTGFVPNSTVGNVANAILNNIFSYAETRPSFSSSAAASAPTYEMNWDATQGKYSITLTDTNNALSSFNFTSPGADYTVTTSGNDLTVTCSNASNQSVTISGNKAAVGGRAQILFLFYGDAQKMALKAGTYNDPNKAYFNLKISGGVIDFEKTSEDNQNGGLEFRVSSEETGYTKDILTDADGHWSLSGVPKGQYTITEINTPDRYYQPATITVDVLDGGRVVQASCYNDCKEDLQLMKVSEDGVVENLKFRVTCAELGYDETVKTDENGEWLIKYLNPGTYVIEEINPPEQFQAPAPLTVQIERGAQLVKVTYENKLKTAQVSMQKMSNHPSDLIAQGIANKPLSGAVYGIYRVDTDELIDTMTTAGADGKATSKTFKWVGDGKFYIQEITPPKYYDLDPTKYYFDMTQDNEIFVRELADTTRIGKLEVSYTESGGSEAPQTGDATNWQLWAVLLCVSMAALGILVVIIIKQRPHARKNGGNK